METPLPPAKKNCFTNFHAKWLLTFIFWAINFLRFFFFFCRIKNHQYLKIMNSMRMHNVLRKMRKYNILAIIHNKKAFYYILWFFFSLFDFLRPIFAWLFCRRQLHHYFSKQLKNVIKNEYQFSSKRFPIEQTNRIN